MQANGVVIAAHAPTDTFDAHANHDPDLRDLDRLWGPSTV